MIFCLIEHFLLWLSRTIKYILLTPRRVFLSIKCWVYLIYEIKKQLNRIERLLLLAKQASSIEFYTIIGGQRKKVVQMFLKATEKLPLSIEVKDAQGNVAVVDGAPQWALTDATVGALTVSADGFSAEFIPAGIIGLTQVQVSVDADLGEGVKSILGTLDVEVLSGEAVSVSIIAGAPVAI